MKFNASKASSNPNVIRIKAGESVKGILRGDPYEYERAFQAGDKPKFRFRVNIVTKANGALVAKILEGGWKIYQQLADLQKNGWDLEKRFIVISRTGSGVQDTVYSVSVTPDAPDANLLAQAAAVTLHPLADGPASQDAPPNTDDCPF